MSLLTTPNELHDFIAARYPRDLQLADGMLLTLTPLVASDWTFLEEFVGAIPDEDRRFFRRDASDQDRVHRWCSRIDFQHVLPLLAWIGRTIVADAVLEREQGMWTSHLGKARLLVHPEYRERGLGQIMLRELADVATLMGLHKLVHECAAEQMELLDFLNAHGFSEAGRLARFVRDRDGNLSDMVVMSRDL
jgi:GNAT superfamily N-acetyltransferase